MSTFLHAEPIELTDVTIDVQATEATAFGISLRIPSWCTDATIRVNGEECTLDPEPSGETGRWNAEYVTLEREWDDERIEVTFEQSVVPLRSHPAVEANAGRIALTRGPLVYCLEGIDNDRPLHHYRIDPESGVEASRRDDLFGGTIVLEGEATVPDLEEWDDELYLPAVETSRVSTAFTAIPYYQWDNREPGEMAVWLRQCRPDE